MKWLKSVQRFVNIAILNFHLKSESNCLKWANYEATIKEK